MIIDSLTAQSVESVNELQLIADDLDRTGDGPFVMTFLKIRRWFYGLR